MSRFNQLQEENKLFWWSFT